jgi:uncharacterized protein (DUF1778 family)
MPTARAVANTPAITVATGRSAAKEMMNPDITMTQTIAGDRRAILETAARGTRPRDREFVVRAVYTEAHRTTMKNTTNQVEAPGI